MGYSRLSHWEREEVSRELAGGSSFRAIGRKLNRHASTISRETRRISGIENYRAWMASRMARRKASHRRLGKRKLCHGPLFERVQEKLRLFWSPQQIARFLKVNYSEVEMNISAESIYTYIYVLPRGALRKDLTQCLRRAHKKRRVKGQPRRTGPSLKDMISIEERPASVADRSVPGHWEGDIIIGGAREQTALGTLVERTTRSLILFPLKNKTAAEFRKAITREVKKLPEQMRLSLTYDQGKEMAEHKLFTKNTKMKVYFAHPQSPWERGTNENTNGLLRQFFPKGINFKKISRARIKHVQDLMNGRPRATLNWKTPYEAMQELLR